MKKLQGKPPSLWLFLPMLITIVMSACTPVVNPAPDADASGVDAVAPFGTYDCQSWCAHAVDLKCSSAAPTEHGATCIDVCKNTLDGPIPFNVQCRSLASSCAAADTCENGLAANPMKPDAPLGAVTAPATCAGWCAHALGLKCPAAQRTPKGSSCVDVCNNVMTGPVKFNLKCRIGAHTCAAADGCEK